MPRFARTGHGTEIVEIGPAECVNGHPLRPPNVAISHLPCSCAGDGGHRVYRCMTCGAVTYEPPHTRDDGQGSAYG